MPEMPEVETIRRSLADKVEGRYIIKVDIRLTRLIKWPEVVDFAGYILHRTITRLERKGKYLVFHLKGGMALVIHLRMTGRLFLAVPDMSPDRFTHVVFHLDNGNQLLYADTRTLGTIYAMEESELGRIAGLTSLGPEPLSKEFTLEYFRRLTQYRKGRIKALLLNQKLVGGLGNIYVDEALAIAGIDPDRTACSLTADETEALYNAINQVIAEGIRHGGTTFRDYRDGTGRKGSYQHELFVYGRRGQPCRRCGTSIERKETAGRGTHFCPACQN